MMLHNTTNEQERKIFDAYQSESPQVEVLMSVMRDLDETIDEWIAAASGCGRTTPAGLSSWIASIPEELK